MIFGKQAELDLSVVIVTYNVAHLLGACLESVFAECSSIRAEVFVVDSGSSDGTPGVVRSQFPDVRLRASSRNIGFSAGNNLAIPECRGRYILLLNPDTIVHPGAFRNLIAYMDKHSAVGAVGPTLRLGDSQIQPECARNLPKLGNLLPWLLLLDKIEWMLRFRQSTRATTLHPPGSTLMDGFCLLFWTRDQTCSVESICGACMMLRREAVQQIGLLDEASPLYLDDIDYCRRMRKAGWSIHYVTDATVTHFREQSSSQLRRAGDFYAMGCHAIWLYLRKHDGIATAMVFAAMACFASLIRLPICVFALALPGARVRTFWRRQLHMALGLSRWAFRLPKAPPRFGFPCEDMESAQTRSAHQ